MRIIENLTQRIIANLAYLFRIFTCSYFHIFVQYCSSVLLEITRVFFFIHSAIWIIMLNLPTTQTIFKTVWPISKLKKSFTRARRLSWHLCDVHWCDLCFYHTEANLFCLTCFWTRIEMYQFMYTTYVSNVLPFNVGLLYNC